MPPPPAHAAGNRHIVKKEPCSETALIGVSDDQSAHPLIG